MFTFYCFIVQTSEDSCRLLTTQFTPTDIGSLSWQCEIGLRYNVFVHTKQQYGHWSAYYL